MTCLPFVAEHLSDGGGIHALEDAIAAGYHITPSRRALLDAAIDLFTHRFQVRFAQHADIHVAYQDEIAAVLLLDLSQIHSMPAAGSRP